LIIFHLCFGLLISPALTSFTIDKINKCCGTKVELERVNVWPLTLSFSLKNLKVYNPDKDDERVVYLKNVSARVSPIGLLSKRFVLSSIRANGVEINIEGEPDGTFNIQKLAEGTSKTKEKKGISLWKGFAGKKDWYGKVYDLLTKKLSKKAVEKEKAERAQAKKVTKEITELPKGRRVYFKTLADNYIFEIRSLEIKNAVLKLADENGKTIEIGKARIDIGRLGLDPVNGVNIGKVDLSGEIKNAGLTAGALDVLFVKSFNEKRERTEFDLNLKNVDLDAVRFIYEESLPVAVKRGIISMRSKTILTDNNIDSRNTLSLTKHELYPKSGAVTGFIPMPVLCEALNGIDPVKLKFDVTGTLENPELSGFQKSLMDLVGPSVKNIGESMLKGKASEAIGGLLGESVSTKKIDSQEVINSVQSLFGGKKE
ncbi:MAG: AsmA family protein, partial [Candidatus Omnitrophica bacterium]|nr:AsmA family protein [Candidatus Omnitrophota bacterium]